MVRANRLYQRKMGCIRIGRVFAQYESGYGRTLAR